MTIQLLKRQAWPLGPGCARQILVEPPRLPTCARFGVDSAPSLAEEVGGGQPPAENPWEPIVPDVREDELSLREQAKSLKHLMTHMPKNPFCPECQRAKMQRKQARRKKGAALGERPDTFGEQITAGHFIAIDEADWVRRVKPPHW